MSPPHRKGSSLSNITIGRYDGCTEHTPTGDRPLTETWAGWVEGTDSGGASWIVYLNGDGRPALYWPKRDADGGVLGEPVRL